MRSPLLSRLHRLIAAIVAAAALTPAFAAAASASEGLGDVDPDAYYAHAVAWMVDEAITTGTEPGCFSPDEAVTRGQIATFLYRLEEARGQQPDTAEHPFIDVLADYQSEPVGWLYATGVTTGTTPFTFSPTAPITRGDFAVMLWRYAGRPQPSGSHGFTDVQRAYRERAVSWMAEQGITTGTSPHTFDPDGLVTRAQAATFLHRFVGSPAAEISEEAVPCSRPMRLALVAGGLTPAEAACAAPQLADWPVEYLQGIVADEIDAAQDWDLLATVAYVAQTCLTPQRIAELTRLFL